MDTVQQNNRHQTIAVWAITPNGITLGQRILSKMPECAFFVSKKMIQKNRIDVDYISVDRLQDSIEKKFNQYDGHVFIFSTGIAVRMIASLIESKLKDPAVVVMDDNANHAISLLSGHLGGANELAAKLGKITGADPVITTATDTNKLPSIDLICQKAGLYIETPQHIKSINMAFLTGEKIYIHDPMNIVKPALSNDVIVKNETVSYPEHRIYCSYRTEPVSRETFIARPKMLFVGMGCNRGTPFDVIHNFLIETFNNQNLSVNSISAFATTDVKKDEVGLLELVKHLGKKITFYDKTALNSITDIPSPSQTVEKYLGVKSVCEAAALLSAGRAYNEPARLIVTKQKNKDVTIAVAINE